MFVSASAGRDRKKSVVRNVYKLTLTADSPDEEENLAALLRLIRAEDCGLWESIGREKAAWKVESK